MTIKSDSRMAGGNALADRMDLGVCLSGYTHFREFPGRIRLIESTRWPGPLLARLSPGLLKKVPVLIYQGGQDPFIPVDYARHLADNLPDADLVLRPEAGHLYPLAEQFQESLFQRLNQYLNNQPRELRTAP